MNKKRQIKQIRWTTLTAMICVCLAAITVTADHHEPMPMGPMPNYRVTIENLSGGQALTPPLIVSHTGDAQLYQVGEPAGEAIQAIAENGNLDPLLGALEGSMAVADVVVSDMGPLVPAGNPGGTDFASSVNLMIHANHRVHYLSFISMLICTNDGFTGLNSVALPAKGSRVLFVSGYDAGTEINTEDFADLVPPCQGLIGISSDDEGTGASNPDLAEGGVVHYHMGIAGGDDLLADVHGWGNPIAKITITRVDEAANRFVAPLSGAGEVPIVATYATGHAEFKIDWEHQKVHYQLYVHGLSGVTQAHIHMGLPSENGGPVAFLFGPADATGLIDGHLAHGMIGADDLINTYDGDFEGFVKALRKGMLYVNVHSADHKPGAIRGQIGTASRYHPKH